MITLDDIKRLTGDTDTGRVLNLRGICQRAGINYQTMLSKLRNDRDLTTTESAALSKALKGVGLSYSKNGNE